VKQGRTARLTRAINWQNCCP